MSVYNASFDNQVNQVQSMTGSNKIHVSEIDFDTSCKCQVTACDGGTVHFCCPVSFEINPFPDDDHGSCEKPVPKMVANEFELAGGTGITPNIFNCNSTEGIYIESEQTLSLVSKNEKVLVEAPTNNIELTANTDIDMIASDTINIEAENNVNIDSKAGDVAIKSDVGNISLNSAVEDIVITAQDKIDLASFTDDVGLTSTQQDVNLFAKKKINMLAQDEKITLDSPVVLVTNDLGICSNPVKKITTKLIDFDTTGDCQLDVCTDPEGDGEIKVCAPMKFIVDPIFPPAPGLQQSITLKFLSILGTPELPGTGSGRIPHAPPGYGVQTDTWPTLPLPPASPDQTGGGLGYFAKYTVDIPAGTWTPQKFAWHIDSTFYTEMIPPASTHPLRVACVGYGSYGGIAILPAWRSAMTWCDNTYNYVGKNYVAGGAADAPPPASFAQAIPSIDPVTGQWKILACRNRGGKFPAFGNTAVGLINVTATTGTITTESISFMKNLLGLNATDTLPSETSTATWLGGMNIPNPPLGPNDYPGPSTAVNFPKIYTSPAVPTVSYLTDLQARLAHLESLH